MQESRLQKFDTNSLTIDLSYDTLGNNGHKCLSFMLILTDNIRTNFTDETLETRKTIFITDFIHILLFTQKLYFLQNMEKTDGKNRKINPATSRPLRPFLNKY